QAIKATEPYLREHEGTSRALLVRAQAAMALLARGETHRRRAEIIDGQEQLMKEAQAHLGAAIRRLEALVEDVAAKTRRIRPTRAGADDLSESEWFSLESNLRFQLARAWRNLGGTHPPESPDRADSLNQAVALATPLAQRESDDRLAWPARVDLLVCHRLRGDRLAVRRRLDSVEEEQPPDWVKSRLRAEEIHLLLDAGRLAEAVNLAGHDSTRNQVPTPELDFARLIAFLESWSENERRKNQADAQRWRASSAELVAVIARRHGPYWSRRAEAMLAKFTAGSSMVTDAGSLRAAAESFYRAGRYDEALKNYDRARQAALASGKANEAFQYAFTAATIEHARKNHAESARRYLELARGSKTHPRAGDAHLRAAYQTGKSAQDDPKVAQEYAKLLEEHLMLFPRGSTANPVRVWHGRVLENRRDWTKAARVYAEVSPSASQYPLAVERLEVCVRKENERLLAANLPAKDWAMESAQQFEKIILGEERQWPVAWNDAHRKAALAAARLWTGNLLRRHERADKLLSTAILGSENAPATWIATANQLRVVALAGQGKTQEANDLLQQVLQDALAQENPQLLFSMIQGMSKAAEGADAATRRQLAQMQIDAVHKLNEQPKSLTSQQRALLNLTHARALVLAGQEDQAIKLFADLAKRHPRDGLVHEEYALALVGSKNKAHWKTAIAKWRELERKSPRGSGRWFRAKYYSALTHYQLGDKRAAAEIIRIAQVLTPELGGPALKRRFLALLGKCKL
ncbi:MAG: hypothetical protein N2C14_14750, partial [Planctomycetales bacterium]